MEGFRDVAGSSPVVSQFFNRDWFGSITINTSKEYSASD
jgi:hypothetical protein